MSVLTVKTKIEDMAIGDIIPCRYKAASGVTGVFSELGACTAAGIPVTGMANPDGKFNFIKSDKGLLIADRVVQTGISWDALNTAGYIQGTLYSYVPILTKDDGNVIFSSCHADTGIVAWYVFKQGETYAYSSSWYAERSAKYPQYIGYNFKTNTEIESVSILVDSYDQDLRPPKNITIQGEKDNTWVDILNVVETGLNTKRNITFKLPTISNYPAYRILINSTYGYAGYTACTVHRVRFNIPKAYNIRSLFGGNAYLGTDVKASLTDKGLGCWPPNNEWDRYIVNSDLGGKIVAGDDNVWHCGQSILSFCQDTPINGFTNVSGSIATNSGRICRGYTNKLDCAFWNSSNSGVDHGFRPVLEYPEDARCTNIWY